MKQTHGERTSPCVVFDSLHKVSRVSANPPLPAIIPITSTRAHYSLVRL
jgi:hypothetical protein